MAFMESIEKVLQAHTIMLTLQFGSTGAQEAHTLSTSPLASLEAQVVC